MTGTDIVTAMIGLVARNKRRYGGYIVHLGVVLIFLGFLVSIEVFRDLRLPFTGIVLRHRREEQEARG